MGHFAKHGDPRSLCLAHASISEAFDSGLEFAYHSV